MKPGKNFEPLIPFPHFTTRMHDSQNHSDHDQKPPALPDALIGELRRRQDSDIEVPASFDRELKKRCHALLEEQTTATVVHSKCIPFPLPPKTRWIAGLAALFILSASITLLLLFNPANPSRKAALESPTILHAFHLARTLEAGEAADPAYDLSGDGRVDRTDVELLAQRAVQLTDSGQP